MTGSEPPPYARIAAELRARIGSGELSPGDRVPSTREITRRWGVAMATATKVLVTLRQEGLVRATPGAGTVVAERAPLPGLRTEPGTRASRRRPGAEPALELEHIVSAAVAIADAEGLASLSMRRVASDTGVATMSLYRHVADKDDLLLRMMDAVFGQAALGVDPAAGWRARVERAVGALWTVFRRHPWLPAVMSVTRPQLIVTGMAYTEAVLAAFDEAGLDPSTSLTCHITLFNYVRGVAVNLEMEAEAEASSGMDNEEWMTTQEPAFRSAIAQGQFPAFERVVAARYDFDLDTIFEFGVQRLLDGIAVLADGARPGPG
ncbi:MAG TPA: TetR/AcrR family transcriptional regulator C-terminal domain-containing protein [Candidatus Dormibacteraeota bacterium]|jgi:DNA-binding transcriptional regulator YhcF (GntR family)|nr:TetR/AcrR family transcriptional regulator C-terminal domain-containing protein [Candidatus Dormibacteraeota bacterium]